MARYMKILQAAEELGLPEDLIRRLTKCYLADRFCFRASGSTNAPTYIHIATLEKMLQDGELKEVLEG